VVARPILNLSLTTKSTAIICIVAFVLIYIGKTTLNLSADRLQNSYLVSKQFQLLDHLDSVVIELARAEAGEKEYLQTGSKAAKERYGAALSQIENDISKLRLLLSDRTQYVMLLEDLTESLSFRKSCAEEVMQLRDASGLEAAQLRSAQFDEEGMTQHVEWLARDVSRTINQEMTNRFSDLDRENLNSMAGISFILASALLALVFVIFGINRYVRERVISETSLREAQRALMEREARVRAIVGTAPDGIVTVTTDGAIETANMVFEQMFGYESGEMIGLKIEKVLPGFTLNHKEAKTGAVKELTGLKQDGTEVSLELSVSAVELGEQGVLIGIVRDITERRVVEERVKDFYSMVSHELRTPLASIRTALGLMESSFATDESRPVVKIASEEADRLMRLINDILDMRKIESGKLELYSDIYSAAQMVGKSVEGISNLGESKSIKFVQLPEPGIEVFCDQDRTMQVLTNMLSNAIKYSPDGGTIIVSTELIGNFCRFAVQDEGPGIPKNQTHKLFGRFEQLRSTDGLIRAGTGLGLAIAKAIVEEQGGQIGVDLPELGGSKFWFSLPLADQSDFDFADDEDDLAAT
jgi:PAS domain S-box-containing protein